MAGRKFSGPIGYGKSVEVPAGGGVWKKIVTEVSYFGDVERLTRRLEDGSSVNNDLSVGNTISIVADPFALENFHTMLYVKWNGALWTIDSVEVRERRLLLRLGGVYNGITAETSPAPESDSGSS